MNHNSEGNRRTWRFEISSNIDFEYEIRYHVRFTCGDVKSILFVFRYTIGGRDEEEKKKKQPKVQDFWRISVHRNGKH